MKKPPSLFTAKDHTLHWLDDMLQLVARFSNENIEPDLSSMTMAELWATYLRLRRRADSQAAV